MTESERIWCCDVCDIALPAIMNFPIGSKEQREIFKIIRKHDLTQFHCMCFIGINSISSTEPEFVDYCEKCGIAIQCGDIPLFDLDIETMNFHKSPALDSVLWHKNVINKPRSKCNGRVIHTMVVE